MKTSTIQETICTHTNEPPYYMNLPGFQLLNLPPLAGDLELYLVQYDETSWSVVEKETGQSIIDWVESRDLAILALEQEGESLQGPYSTTGWVAILEFRNIRREYKKLDMVLIQNAADLAKKHLSESQIQHAQSVVNEVYSWADLLPNDTERSQAVAAARLHDVLEDTDLSYNDLVDKVGALVADIVYDVTNELGRTRTERLTRTYPKIASSKLATFVKLCDRLANITRSNESGHRMADVYKSEYPAFRAALYNAEHGFDLLWGELNREHGIL